MAKDSEMDPSEFGGSAKPNGFQRNHQLTASEKLRSVYTTGDETGLKPLDEEGAAFTGLLPKGVQGQTESE